MNELVAEDARADYYEHLNALHEKLSNSRAMLEAARTLGAPLMTIELWQRIVAQDQREVIAWRDHRTVQKTLPISEQAQEKVSFASLYGVHVPEPSRPEGGADNFRWPCGHEGCGPASCKQGGAP